MSNFQHFNNDYYAYTYPSPTSAHDLPQNPYFFSPWRPELIPNQPAGVHGSVFSQTPAAYDTVTQRLQHGQTSLLTASNTRRLVPRSAPEQQRHEYQDPPSAKAHLTLGNSYYEAYQPIGGNPEPIEHGKPYARCPYCQKVFPGPDSSTRSILSRHKKRHCSMNPDGKKTVLCNLCGRDFARPDIMKKHKTEQHGVAP